MDENLEQAIVLEETPSDFELLLNKAIENAENVNTDKWEECPLNLKQIKLDFSTLETTGQKTENICRLLNIVNAYKPTSTSAERVFSVAQNTVTKLRTKMDDETLNALIFLKYHFLKIRKTTKK